MMILMSTGSSPSMLLEVMEKNFLIEALLSMVRGLGKIALTVASSGIAAELLECGRTAHYRFKIPIPINE